MALFVVAAGIGACSGEDFPTPGDYPGSAGASGSSGAPAQGGAPGTAGSPTTPGGAGAPSGGSGPAGGGMPGSAGQFTGAAGSGPSAAGSPGSNGGSGPGPGPTGPGGSGFGQGGAGPSAGSPGASGSGSGSSGAPATAVAFSAVAPIIGMRCATPGCHSPGATMPVLANDANLYQTLTTRTTTRCDGDMLVAKSDPANSALVNMITKKCGSGPFVMPLTCTTPPCIPQSELTTITNWIQAGAPQ